MATYRKAMLKQYKNQMVELIKAQKEIKSLRRLIDRHQLEAVSNDEAPQSGDERIVWAAVHSGRANLQPRGSHLSNVYEMNEDSESRLFEEGLAPSIELQDEKPIGIEILEQ